MKNLIIQKKFYEESLKELKNILKNLRKDNIALKIIGFSGLCVTRSGIGLFENIFGCKEREFINTEHILKKDRKIEVFYTHSKTDLKEKLDQGYELVNRCKMLVTYPGEKSIVWTYLS